MDTRGENPETYSEAVFGPHEEEAFISDSEDHLLQKTATERQRPSFTLGGSDSDSTVTSVDIDYLDPNSPNPKLYHPNQLNFFNEFNPKNAPETNNSTNYTPTTPTTPTNPKPPINSKISTKKSHRVSKSPQPHLNPIPSASNISSSNSRTSTPLNGSGTLTLPSDPEIRLYASDDSAPAFTRRQWLTFIIFGFVELFSAMVISLQAPFYPREAEKKGAKATEYGLVFGIFELTIFIISPIYGSKIKKIGPKTVFILGIFTTSLASIGFGFLDKLDDRTLFIGLSILTRIIEALGEAAFITASFVIIAAEFPQAVATTFASMETFYGLGLITGPLAGGFLYQLGGYILPFLSVGGLLLIAAFSTMFILPKTANTTTIDPQGSSFPEGSEGAQNFRMFSLLKIPSIGLAAFTIFSAACSIGYLNATLEPHIRQFDLAPVTTGAMFIVNGGVYALSAPGWGWLCDQVKHHQLKHITILGSLLIIMGFGLIGPVPYVPLETTLWGVITGQAIQGLGLGAVLVSAFIQALKDAIKNGFRDDISTYGLVSGMWTSMFALGSFVGPSASGVLYDWVGFRMGTFSILGLQFVVTVLVFFSMCCECSEDSLGSEEEPLLPHSNSAVSTSTLRVEGQSSHNGTYGSA